VKRLFIFLLATLALQARAQLNESAVRLTLADSMRLVFEKTKAVDAGVVGSGFVTAWNSLSPQQQQVIEAHTRLMRYKRFPARPHLVNYFGALVNAVNVERVDETRLGSYLRVAGNVIEQASAAKADRFFSTCRGFFENHTLYQDRAYRLYALTDDYSFEYIGGQQQMIVDTVQSQTPEETQTENQDESSDDTATSDDDSSDDSTEEVYVEKPMWETLPPPPDIEGAVIRLNKVTLNIATRYDSTFVRDTKLVVSLTENVLNGEGGTFDWSAAGLPPDSVYCNLTTYRMTLSKSELRADLVHLNYTGKTPGLIPGVFEFQSPRRPDSVFSTYPRFKSYQSDLKIQGLADENVLYTGGFSLTGRNISSGSFFDALSTIEVLSNGKRKFIAESPQFVFSDSTITSEKTKIKILDENDSLTHHQVRIRYTYGDSIQNLVIVRDKGSMRNAPYSSSYYNIDFAADIIRWDVRSDSMNFFVQGGSSEAPMIIESTNYYDKDDFELLQAKGFNFSPLALVVKYCLKKKVREFYSGDLAVFYQRDALLMKQAVIFLYEKGMVEYDVRTDLVRVKPKAIGFYRSHYGQADYDNMKILSVVSAASNATMNLKNKYMTVRGVEEFKVSDSLNVRIKPDSATITLLRDRDIKFDGTINAGNFEISGKGFMLKYDSFFIDLKQIDSINFYVIEKNARGQEVRKKINNSMVGTDSTAASAIGMTNTSQKSGTLFISRPDNKSGKKKIPNYPRLDATGGGVIYFDREEVLSGVYDKSIFFVIPPFKLDSLNDADPASINFDGTFISNGMFPSFKEKLHTMPDKSLGFEHPIPAKGYQLFQGDGNLKGELKLDNQGLRANGVINFLGATIPSSDFIFYPDSVTTKSQGATISKKQFGSVLFPKASLPAFSMKWYPKEDKMILKNVDKPFSFYDSLAQMYGTLTISKNGVAGAGKFVDKETELISANMNFTGDGFSARHAKYKANSADPNKPLMTGYDIRLKFNLKENYADLSPEVEGEAALEFPYAQFKTSIPRARWNVKEEKIVMTKDASTPLENSYFYTTRKELDSLNFLAEKAEYDLKTQQLTVSGIPYIVVADAKITPENNKVLILENAKINTLKNTTIVVDTLNGYHTLTDGVVDIISRKEFSGYATYRYINLLNDTFNIKMTDFHLEPVAPTEGTRKSNRRKSQASLQTVATGSVRQEEKLVLGAGLYYKGDLIMYATRPALTLDGYIQPDIRNIKNYNGWIKYQQSGEETEIIIDYDNALTEEGKKVNAGLHFTANDHKLYLTFCSDLLSDDDDDFFLPSGKLLYDKEKNVFHIEDLEKAAGTKLSGTQFTYSDEKQTYSFEGRVNLFQNAGSGFKVTTSAAGSGTVTTEEMKMNALVILDGSIPPAALDIMGKQIAEVIKNEGAAEGLGDAAELLYKVANIAGERATKDYEQKSQQGFVSLATIAELAKPVVFADVNLKWHPKYKAFYSEGNLGLSHIMRTDCNGGFEGFMESKFDEGGAMSFHVFFKASPEAWYYIAFEDNRLIVHSSNTNFNGVISKKSNAGKVKAGEIATIPGTDDEVLEFVNRFRKQYYGIEVPYSLSDGTQAGEKKKDEKKKKEEEDDGF